MSFFPRGDRGFLIMSRDSRAAAPSNKRNRWLRRLTREIQNASLGDRTSGGQGIAISTLVAEEIRALGHGVRYACGLANYPFLSSLVLLETTFVALGPAFLRTREQFWTCFTI